ncbi:hypothetical protein BT96DRAFT_629246 [Gymnopus androsaceus JB14]|uniref:Uncharacterized protein n=1 Tax=Gymnopus androsaceus JB14 TaxID=1447944 RepID=A0A6A4IGZ6_9AGAR|nr:hypothetical protein BT96DRAFT_629246 [Gymnopus androsaceus JB14]
MLINDRKRSVFVVSRSAVNVSDSNWLPRTSNPARSTKEWVGKLSQLDFGRLFNLQASTPPVVETAALQRVEQSKPSPEPKHKDYDCSGVGVGESRQQRR